MQLTFQPAELDEFAATVSAKWRKKFDTWSKTLTAVHNGQMTKPEACAALGVNVATLNRKIAAIKEFGWRGLVPNYKAPTRLTNDFVDFWKTLQESYQRCTAPAYRELCRKWRDRESIPGYAGHPGWPDLPPGWDKRNLYRYQATKLELTALRHGMGKAVMKHGIKVHSTRVGLWHLSHIVSDDVKLDMKGHVLTARQMCVPLQIGMQDVLSACRFVHGTKPQLLRDSGMKTGIKEADMRFALASQLYNHGISARGTTYLLEHGTATLRSEVMDIMKRAFGDLVTFDMSGMIGKMQAIAGMGDGKGGGGNPFFKAWIESLHNYIHNELSALPAQTGHDRDEPEFLSVIEREHDQIWRLARLLPPEVIQDLKFPTLEFHSQLVPAINKMLEVINQRTIHNLEGWEKCGFLTKSYRLAAGSAEWVNESQLMLMRPEVRQAYLVMAEADKRCFQPRKLSPREVFNMGVSKGEIIRPPHGVIAEILYQDLARPRECRDGFFAFEDREIAPGELRYESRVMQPNGREIELTDREKYETVVNPFDPSVMWLFSATRGKGSFLGVSKRDDRACRADTEAANRKHGRVNERMAAVLAGTRARNVHRTTTAAARKEHNMSLVTQSAANRAAFTRKATAALNASLPNATASDDSTNNDTAPHEINPRKLF
ncbi:hypothetical protein [Prosthecobacter sp.]|jgi:hypothetical protein|uniref:hypothetical protein n=1 Tax=Prosthecobacter sp. TaxID=1965333 RepID=UPI0037CAD5E6